MEEIDVLEDHGNIGGQAVAGKFHQVMPAEGNRAGLRVVKAGNQAADRRLAGAGRTDNCGRRLFGNRKRDVFQHLPRIVAEVDIFECKIEVRKGNVFAAGVEEVRLTQRVELVHRIVNHAERVRAVADGLEACKNAERIEHEHQHHRKRHLAAQIGKYTRKRQRSASAFERKQVQGIARHIAPLDLEVNVAAGIDRACDRLQARAALAEDFDHRKPSRILQRHACLPPTGKNIPIGQNFAEKKSLENVL